MYIQTITEMNCAYNFSLDKDSVKSSKNQTIIKEMLDLAYLGIGDCLDTKVENEYVYKKK